MPDPKLPPPKMLPPEPLSEAMRRVSWTEMAVATYQRLPVLEAAQKRLDLKLDAMREDLKTEIDLAEGHMLAAIGALSRQIGDSQRKTTPTSRRYDLGETTATGSYKVDVVEKRLHELEEAKDIAEAEKRGAEMARAEAQGQAMHAERQRDRLLKWTLGLITALGAAGTAIVYLAGHFHL